MAYGRGHVRGTKRERPGPTPEFDRIQAEWLRKIDAEWAEREAAKPQAGTK